MVHLIFKIGVHWQEKERKAAWRERGRREGKGGSRAGEPQRKAVSQQLVFSPNYLVCLRILGSNPVYVMFSKVPGCLKN